MAPDPDTNDSRVRLPGLDPDATPVVGVGLGLTGLILGLRPRLAAWPLALTAAAALLFRDPDRTTPDEPGVLFAPADGVVRSIEETYEHRFLHTDAVRMTIAVSPIDVPVQRSPVAGRVVYLDEIGPDQRIGWVQRGGEGERGSCMLIGISAGFIPVLLAISASALARRVQLRVAMGDVVPCGARLATARLGARVELLLPGEAAADLPAIGSRVRAGCSRIGRLVPR